jgi:isoleucyl-tRNA synthetase
MAPRSPFKPVDPHPDFPQLEEHLLKHWYRSGIVKKYLQKNHRSRKRFSFLDGPITANNPMGVHHAWGRTYKDLWQRYSNMRGYRQRFQNGFDCQGLWVEVEVEKELGLKSKKDIENLVPGNRTASIAKFVNLCKARVRKFAAIQTKQSQRLGYFMDWDHSYLTMSDDNNYMIWNFLKKCHQHGLIYKGRDSVPWCPRCGTAISQHEILTEDYKQLTHDSIYIAFPLNNRPHEYLLVWTTTPWTIPANIAVAVDPQLKYSLVKTDSGNYWIARELVSQIFNSSAKIIKTLPGDQLTGWKYSGPFDDLPAVKKVASHHLFHTVIPTDQKIMPISVTEGTGLVHTSTGTGAEDFRLGLKLNLPVIPAIEEDATYLSNFGWLSGKNAKRHPQLILDYLKNQNNWAFRIEPYAHRYPVCWRCKTELVWRVVDEWYVSMDKKLPGRQSPKTRQSPRQLMKQAVKKIHWLPQFGLKRELDWLSNMHDWLISKKRYWGLALPIWECSHCGNFEIVGSLDELKTRAVQGWNQFSGHSPHRPWIDHIKIACSSCGKLMSRIPDVGNPWLDAGIIAYSTITRNNQGSPLYLTDKSTWKQWFPADFITESFPGQFKNWFYSMIAQSTILENRPPFKNVLGFGTLLDETGRPMHKSWGNAIEFNQGAKQIGVDVMRWMYALQDPAENLLFGYHKADLVRRQFHLLLWNTFVFFITYANLDHLPVNRIKSSPRSSKNLTLLDHWILSRLELTRQLVTKSLNAYQARPASENLQEFVSDFSTWYVRRSRNRVGSNSSDTQDKLAFYQTTYLVFATLSRLLAPFVPFISDTIYTHITQEDSVHLSNWPGSVFRVRRQLLTRMAFIRTIIELGHSQRKQAGIPVRQPLSKITVKSDQAIKHPQLIQLLQDELNIKQVLFKRSSVKHPQVTLDTQLTPELRDEGRAREITRQIQTARKQAGCRLTESIQVILPDWPQKYTDAISKKTLSELKKGPSFKIIRRPSSSNSQS